MTLLCAVPAQYSTQASWVVSGGISDNLENDESSDYNGSDTFTTNHTEWFKVGVSVAG
jgi:hypothetical protein